MSSELGTFPYNPILSITTKLRPGKKVLFPLPKNTKEIITHIKNLTESGDFTPVIDRTYKLSEIEDAYRYVETGQKTGNVVVIIPQ